MQRPRFSAEMESPSTDTATVATNAGARPFFALLIGINQYMHHATLNGSVRDAQAFRDYLEQDLEVPLQNITLLADDRATREAIIGALKNMANDPRIPKDSAFVIYFAGHGARINADPNWECGRKNGKIECIVPYDQSDAAKEPVPAIPDRTLKYLIIQIAKNKGNNITVIFDCCYSGSGTRDLDLSLRGLTARATELHGVYHEDIDKDIIEHDSEPSRGTFINNKYALHAGSDSHILLAASSSTQQAYEADTDDPISLRKVKRGLFSVTLLKLLRSVSPYTLRYSEILHRLDPIQSQTPQCEGDPKNMQRTLFNLVSRPDTLSKGFSMKCDGSGSHTVEAGLIHNISTASEFVAYYRNDILRRNPLGTIRVQEGTLKNNSFVPRLPSLDGKCPVFTGSDPKSPVVVIQDRFARNESKDDDLMVWVDPSSPFSTVLGNLMHEYEEELQNVSLASDHRGSDIEFKLTSTGKLSLEMYALSPPLPIKTPPTKWTMDDIDQDSNNLVEILSRAATFYGELKRKDNNPKLSKAISVEFYELENDLETLSTDENAHPMSPKSENLFKEGVVDLKVPISNGQDTKDDCSPYSPYGIKLTNRSNVNLYVNVLTFENKNLKISPFVYTNPTANGPYKMDSQLKRLKKGVSPSDNTTHLIPGTLAIGYGSAGYSALSFKADGPPGHPEVDYIKIYLTTEPVDLTSLEQDSPFNNTAPRAIIPLQAKRPSTWSHIIIPVIEHPYII